MLWDELLFPRHCHIVMVIIIIVNIISILMNSISCHEYHHDYVYFIISYDIIMTMITKMKYTKYYVCIN